MTLPTRKTHIIQETKSVFSVNFDSNHLIDMTFVVYRAIKKIAKIVIKHPLVNNLI